jgi:hypothetical protein
MRAYFSRDFQVYSLRLRAHRCINQAFPQQGDWAAEAVGQKFMEIHFHLFLLAVEDATVLGLST